MEAARKEKMQAVYELSKQLTVKKMAERRGDYLDLAAMMRRSEPSSQKNVVDITVTSPGDATRETIRRN